MNSVNIIILYYDGHNFNCTDTYHHRPSQTIAYHHHVRLQTTMQSKSDQYLCVLCGPGGRNSE